VTVKDERGFTLIEVTVAVAILGIAVAAIVTGLMTAISATTYDGNISNADTVLRNYANTIKKQVAATCKAGVTTYTTAITPSASGFSLSPAVGTTENCPTQSGAPKSLDLSVTKGSGSGLDGAATDKTTVWLWLP
jgi:prepilin-type N-terminal cleavage/methylation domain-containing protein